MQWSDDILDELDEDFFDDLNTDLNTIDAELHDEEDNIEQLDLDIIENYEKAEPCIEENQSDNVYVAQLFLHNKGYEVGAPNQYGAMNQETKIALVKYLQFQLGYYGCGVAVTGEFNSDTLTKVKRFLPIQKNSPRPYLIKAFQIALLCHGYRINLDNAIDGTYSLDTRLAVEQFQMDNDLVATGTINSETAIALFA